MKVCNFPLVERGVGLTENDLYMMQHSAAFTAKPVIFYM